MPDNQILNSKWCQTQEEPQLSTTPRAEKIVISSPKRQIEPQASNSAVPRFIGDSNTKASPTPRADKDSVYSFTKHIC